MTNAGSASSLTPDPHIAKEALKHFATAFAFLLVGLSALVWNSGKLSQGAIADPHVLGGLHWITLGWLSLSIFGALRVFTGVALGDQGLATPLVVASVRRLWSAGAVLFPVGLMAHSRLLIFSGVSLIGLALILFTIQIVPALLRSRREGVTRWFLAIAVFSLWETWLLGGAAASVRAGHPLATLPSGYFSAHVLVAVFGWVGATVVGVGAHLIPMFALSREPSNLPVKIALGFWFLIPVFAGIGAFVPDPFLSIAWGAAFAGSLLWILQVMIYFRTRLRKERDPGLFLAAGSTALLGAALAVGTVQSAPVTFVGLAIIGWLTLFTLGIYHRVLPFLIWFARFARNAGKGPVPKVKDLIDEKVAFSTAGVTLIGACLWSFGLFSQFPELLYAGSSLILFGSALSLGQIRTLAGFELSKGGTSRWGLQQWIRLGKNSKA